MKHLVLAALAATAMALPLRADPLEEARVAYLAAWEGAPLAVRRAMLVSQPATSYGLPDERATNAFAADEPVLIYLEPVGYGWREAGGLNEFGVRVAVRALTPAGDQLFAKEDFLILSTTSRDRPTEFFANVTLNMSGFPRGRVDLELTLSDLASDESATVTLPLVLE